MVVTISFGIYFALLGLIAYEDLFAGKDSYTLKA